MIIPDALGSIVPCIHPTGVLNTAHMRVWHWWKEKAPTLLSQFKMKQQEFAVLQVSCLEFQSKFQWILPARMWELYAGCSGGSGTYRITFCLLIRLAPTKKEKHIILNGHCILGLGQLGQLSCSCSLQIWAIYVSLAPPPPRIMTCLPFSPSSDWAQPDPIFCANI